jgi:DNA gyrase subunit B
MTVLHSGGKFDDTSYKVSGGLHGVGVSVVNALSDFLELNIRRDGKLHRQEYRLGEPRRRSPPSATPTSGHDAALQAQRADLHQHLLQLRHAGQASARAVVPELRRAHRTDRRARREERSVPARRRPEGLRHAFEPQQDGGAPTVLWFQTRDGNTQVEVAMQWNDSYQESMYCYTNNIPQKDGGTHLAGYRAALTRTLNNYIEKELAAKKEKIADHRRRLARRLTAILSVKLPDPKFSSQTKDKLVSSEVKGVVESAVAERARRSSCWSIRRKRAPSSTKSSRPPMRARRRARRAR